MKHQLENRREAIKGTGQKAFAHFADLVGSIVTMAVHSDKPAEAVAKKIESNAPVSRRDFLGLRKR